MDNSAKKKAKSTGKTTNSIPAFLLKTYEILEVSDFVAFGINRTIRTPSTRILFPGTMMEPLFL